MARILVIADAGATTGFGVVTHNAFERIFQRYGHDISVLAANYQGDPWPTPLRLFRANLKEDYDIVGMSRIAEVMAKVVPEVIVFIQDPKVVLNCFLGNPWDEQKLLWRGMTLPSGQTYRPPIVAYLAIDGYNSPKSWDQLLERPGLYRVAMSEFGRRTAMPEAPVVHHGVDTEVFKPRDRAEAKRALGFDPGRFLVLRVDKNNWRKDYPSTWRALRPVMRAHPDIDVHFHCIRNSREGYDLDAVRWNDEDIRDRVSYTDNLGGYIGVPQGQLAALYNAADLFISTSWGEGFGLTILEALASGTPVVAPNHSAVTEVVGDAGILVDPLGRMYVPMGQEQCRPDVAKFSYWIERLYESRSLRDKLSEAGPKQAAKFTWDDCAAGIEAVIERALAEHPAVEVPTDALRDGGRPAISDQEEVRAVR